MKAASKTVATAGRRRRWLVLPAIVAALAAAGGFAAYLTWWPRELCRQWEARVAAADERSLASAVDGLDRCGRYAVRPLVELLASTKPAAADAGEEALARRIRRLRAGGHEAWTDAAELAETLVAALPAAPAESQPRHLRLAMSLLEAAGRLSIDFSVDESAQGRVTVACENILRRAEAGVEPAKFVAENAAPLKPASRGPGVVKQAASESPQSRSADASGPVLPTPAPLPTAMPAAPVTIPAQQPAEAAPLPRTAANASARVNPIRRGGAQGVQPATALEPSDAPASSAMAPAAMLATRTAWSLFADLAAEGPSSSLASAELYRRGFRSAEIELGRQFAAADPADRVRLAESLPYQSGVDVRPWLVHLSEDDDPSVRLAVVTIMATTNDPQMLSRLRQIAIADADEAVRLRARKLSDQSGRLAPSR